MGVGLFWQPSIICYYFNIILRPPLAVPVCSMRASPSRPICLQLRMAGRPVSRQTENANFLTFIHDPNFCA